MSRNVNSGNYFYSLDFISIDSSELYIDYQYSQIFFLKYWHCFLSQTWIILFFLIVYWFYLMIVIFAHCLNWKTHLYIAITFLVQLAAFNKYNNFMFSTSFLGSRISMNLLAAFSDCTSVIFILTVCYRQYFIFQGY